MKYSSRFFLYAPFAGLLLLAGIAGGGYKIEYSSEENEYVRAE